MEPETTFRPCAESIHARGKAFGDRLRLRPAVKEVIVDRDCHILNRTLDMAPEDDDPTRDVLSAYVDVVLKGGQALTWHVALILGRDGWQVDASVDYDARLRRDSVPEDLWEKNQRMDRPLGQVASILDATVDELLAIVDMPEIREKLDGLTPEPGATAAAF